MFILWDCAHELCSESKTQTTRGTSDQVRRHCGGRESEVCRMVWELRKRGWESTPIRRIYIQMACLVQVAFWPDYIGTTGDKVNDRTVRRQSG